MAKNTSLNRSPRRTSLRVLLVAITLLAGASVSHWGSVTAQSVPINWVCFPTCAEGDSRFLGVSGTNTGSIAGQEIFVGISAAPFSTEIPISIFDGDSRPAGTGRWDIGTSPGLKFELYADPLGDQSGLALAPIGMWLGGDGVNPPTMPDNAWFELTDPTSGTAPIQNRSSAQEAGCELCPYRYILKVSVHINSTSGVSNFKVRSGGTVYMKPQTFGFYGARASLDIPFVTPATYDGTWDFDFFVPPSTTAFEIWDGDLDYGSFDCQFNDTDDPDSPTYPAFVPLSEQGGNPVGPQGVPVTTLGCSPPIPGQTTTGIPADNNANAAVRREPLASTVSAWSNASTSPDGQAHIVENVIYRLIAPDNREFLNDNPSGNIEWERFRLDTAPFDRNLMDYHVDGDENGYLPSGLWKLRVEGQDLANLSVWRSSFDTLGRDPDGNPTPPDAFYSVGGYAFYDAGTIGVNDGDSGLQNVELALVDADGNIMSTTFSDSLGAYSFRVQPGTYTVRVITPPLGLVPTTQPGTYPDQPGLTVGGTTFAAEAQFGFREPPDNGPPVAVDDTATTPAGVPVSIPVVLNDSDPDGDILTIVSFTQPPAAEGVVTQSLNLLIFTPAPGFAGVSTFTYTISDGTDTDTANVTVTVEAVVNQPPTANPDAATTPSGTPVSVSVVTNDTDPDGDTLTVTSFTTPPASEGSVSQSGNVLTFTPAANFVGVSTFSYEISDGNGGTATTTVTITVTNRPPTAVDDAATTPSGTPVSITVLDNDTDPESQPLTVTSFTPAPVAEGTVSQSGNVLTFTPAPGFVGVSTFTYTIDDGNGGTDTATVTVTVTNQPPTANPDSATTPSGTPVSVSVVTNDTDPEGQTLTVTSFTTPPASEGSVSQSGNVLTFTPAANFVGVSTFSYEISDGNGGTATTTVTITVTNRPPTAVDDAATTPYSTPVSITVLDNDSDPESQPLSVTSFTAPPASEGTVSQSGNVLTFTPAAGFAGVSTFSYTISDGHGGTATANVTITVNKRPVTVSVPNVTTTFNGNPQGTSCSATDNLAGTLTYSGSGYGPSAIAPTNAGTYTATCTVEGDATHEGPTTGTGTVTINKRDAIVTANSTSKVYGTTLTFAGTEFTTSGFLGTDGVTSASLASTGAAAGAAAGTYDITIGSGTGNGLSNYNITYVKGTLTVTPPTTICSATGYTTYSQGGWGAPASGNNPGNLLHSKFAQVYPGGSVVIGGTFKLTFTSAQAVTNFLPQGGASKALTASATNPTSSSAGNLAAQVLAMQLAVDFSAAGVLKAGLGSLVMVSGPFAGQSVNQVMAVANAVLGGQSSALPSGVNINALKDIVESLIMNFHEGTANDGLVGCAGPGSPSTPPVVDPPPPPPAPAGDYRMTGGGTFGVATHGFTLRCNVQQGSNNLEVNWGKGNKFHLENLTAASCFDDPSIKPAPPAAPFDTYVGKGTGRYNGAPATAEWTFTDAGEPGTKDFATIVIRAANGSVVLSTSGKISKGNQQAHK